MMSLPFLNHMPTLAGIFIFGGFGRTSWKSCGPLKAVGQRT